MYGGLMGVGTPGGLVRVLLESGARDLTIVGSDTGFPGIGVGPLVEKRRIKRVITSHTGTNPETGRQMIAGESQVDRGGNLARSMVPGNLVAGMGVWCCRRWGRGCRCRRFVGVRRRISG